MGLSAVTPRGYGAGMGNRTPLMAIPLLALVMTGCFPGSDQTKAHAACIDSAKGQLPKSAEQIDTSKLETAQHVR